ncbi:MAG TPA: hypothetical protein VFG18_06735 [Xanthomonadaceae bacterium]|nr:hypothetical protein [Xanthomonadaceae bacterium]
MRALLPLLLALALALPLRAAAAPAAQDRAVWVWERDAYAMVESRTMADEAFAFLRDKDVNVLYLYADAWQGRNLIVDRPQAYRRFIARAHDDGFKVYALLGSAYLKTEEYVLPGRLDEAGAMFQRVLDYNAAAAEGERFDGVNYDIEPHLLDAWDTRRTELLLGFLDMTADFARRKAASGQRLAIGPAMPFWWDNIRIEWRGNTRPMSEHVADLTDYVALMDYRNEAEGNDGIVDHAEAEIAYAARAGRKVVIGLELSPSEPRKVTFNHLTEADLAREMRLTERALGASPAFGGFVLHHYRGYVEWVRRQAAE